MTKRTVLPRRAFLRCSALASGAVALAACTAAPPATPSAPASPQVTKAPVAAPTTAPAAAPTKAPAALPTAAPAAAPTKAPVTAPTTAPAATAAPKAAPPAAEKPGKHLIGKLQGPEIIADPAQFPKSFKEAPMLADLVKAGKLPPVEQRLPQDPLVVKPFQSIGKYGGTWRRGFTGPADTENGNRIVATDKLLLGDYTGLKTVPSLAKSWQVGDGGRTITLFLRKGLKWSDGAPFTADDIIFWYEDIFLNKDLIPIPDPEMVVNGKWGKLEKVDDSTVAFKFPDPYYLFVELLTIDSKIGAGQAMGSAQWPFVGGYAPKHYLKQFHPKYVSKEELDKKVKEGGYDNWVNLMRFKHNWSLNTELPVVGPWRTATPINTPTWVLERNPYYWEVDTAGNQLPYIDKIVMTLAENLEVLNLRAMAGEYDAQGRHIDLAKLPVLLQNQEKGGYKIWLSPADYGCDACLFVNLSYEADPEVARWLTNVDFRRALSLGIDRDQLNEIFWMGVGTPGSPVVADNHPYNPGPEYRTLWSTYDVKKANEMLDKIGLNMKDGEGFRLRTDGKGRLRIEVADIGAAFLPLTQIAEALKEHWKKIGVEIEVKEIERSLMGRRAGANELQIQLNWGNTGTENLLTRPQGVLPTEATTALGPEYFKWYASGGSAGKKPADAQLIRAYELLRSSPGLPPEEQVKVAKDIWRLAVDQQWTIGTVGLGPAIIGVHAIKLYMGNVPQRFSIIRTARVPGGSHCATWFFNQ